MNNTEKRVVLITGASSGIGKFTAIQLAEEGYQVYAAARRLDKMTELKERGIIPIALDITNEESIQTVINEITQQQGRIDVLVNNAGYGSHGALEEISPEEARRQFDVNVFGLMRLTQLILPKMREEGSGKIINISSIAGQISTPMCGWYNASKHSLEALSDALRLEVKQFGIDVIVIEPGLIKTEFDDVVMQQIEKTAKTEIYQDWRNTWIKIINQSYKNAVGPEAISEIISKAITAKKPKNRYVAPTEAKILLFLHWLLSDKAFDKVILSVIKSRQRTID